MATTFLVDHQMTLSVFWGISELVRKVLSKVYIYYWMLRYKLTIVSSYLFQNCWSWLDFVHWKPWPQLACISLSNCQSSTPAVYPMSTVTAAMKRTLNLLLSWSPVSTVVCSETWGWLAGKDILDFYVIVTRQTINRSCVIISCLHNLEPLHGSFALQQRFVSLSKQLLYHCHHRMTS